MERLEAQLNDKLEKAMRRIARFGSSGRGNPYKLNRKLTNILNLMDENGFDYDPYYEEMDGYEEMMDALEQRNSGSGSDSD